MPNVRKGKVARETRQKLAKMRKDDRSSRSAEEQLKELDMRQGKALKERTHLANN